MRGVLTRCRRLFLSNGDASPSCCAMLKSGCCRRQFAFFVAPAQLFAARTAAKQTEVVSTESWILRPLPRSPWGYQGRARTMCEKFKMKNVASKTDRAPFTVWVKVGFPVGMITQCACRRCSKLEETVTRKPEPQAKEHQPEALAREGKPEARAKVFVARYPPCFE